MSISNNLFCQRKINSFIKQFTNTIITNTDAESHAIVFNNNRLVFQMSVAKTTLQTPPTIFIGYFQWTWGGQSTLPECVNAGIAYSGWSNPSNALQQSLNVYASLKGSKYITLGGSIGSNGTCSSSAFSWQILYNIYNAINNGLFSGYAGIVFDVEYVLGSGLYTSSGQYSGLYGFKQVFALAKQRGLDVILCVSQSGNIGITNTTYECTGLAQDTTLMNNFLSDPSIHYISPKLFVQDGGLSITFNADIIPWTELLTSGKLIIPTLPLAQNFTYVEKTWAIPNGITLSGGIQWQNSINGIGSGIGSGAGSGGITGTQYTFTSNSEFKQAFNNWFTENQTLIISQYGIMSDWLTGNITDMSFMFGSLDANSNFVPLPQASTFTGTNKQEFIGNWDTSGVINMGSMFFGASVYNGYISRWNTSNVKFMNTMFFQASMFNQHLLTKGNVWDVSNVTDMSYMFFAAGMFNGNISNWNTSAVTDMSYMFYTAPSFNRDLSKWNVSNVTNMNNMFSNTYYNQPLFSNTIKVTNMNNMFNNAVAFTQDLSNLITSAVTDMSQMFYQATAFNGDISNWDTSSVTNMNGMFYDTAYFNCDISNWDTSSVTNMSGMFAAAYAFNKDLLTNGKKWDVSNVTNMSDMFGGTVQGIGIDFNGNISNWNTSAVTDMSNMFSFTTTFNNDITNWNVSNVTNMNQMFMSAKTFNKDISIWNISTKKPTINGTFQGSAIPFDTPINNNIFNSWLNYGYSASELGQSGLFPTAFNTNFIIINNTLTTLTIVPGFSRLNPTSPSTNFLVPNGQTWTGESISYGTIELNFSNITPQNNGNIILNYGAQSSFSFGSVNIPPNNFSALVIVTDSGHNILSSNTFNDAISHNIGPTTIPFIPSGSTISITYSGP